ncbi:MAG: tRNA (N(6)-L-threonylcarbamoyladenosine(37)-C(2))-methylthiotransferase MtaB [Candidatus Delongbacteria bacterium]|nr:tRNA (N(6)-L-threonylcarbamoyladenosine(37)-C(2))-methylthiotransferase MtaB [Candidatus Delongbacteria bacterium]MBN2833818.1 tRNA (N(6)-L-threonylcarbamoyladenosine(37)-C(2))-methylthiotransferase MtaB [Candidatus Delongbacteria bacterium]
MEKVCIYTFGCKINIFDSEVIKDKFSNEGYEIVKKWQDADIIVVNSCTVTHKADNKFYDFVKKVKRDNPTAKVVALGCLTELEPESVLRTGNIDLLLGSSDKFEVVERIRSGKLNIVNRNETEPIFYDYHINNFHHHTRAFLKIQDGCDNYCTYCTIPKARGKSRSKSLSSILEDIRSLSENDYKEIIISGIDLGSYRDGNLKLSDAIEEILKIDGFRLRVSSVEPWCFDKKLIDLILNNNRICPHFHIPLQNASDAILKKMGRKYRIYDFNSLIEKLALRENIMISTDMITGFPGESEEDFKQNLNYLRDSKITYAHIFSYSDRPRAASKNLPYKIPAPVIKSRSEELHRVSTEKKAKFYDLMIDKTFEIIGENSKKISGYTENYLPVKISNTIKIEQNKIYRIKIDGYFDDICTGIIV